MALRVDEGYAADLVRAEEIDPHSWSGMVLRWGIWRKGITTKKGLAGGRSARLYETDFLSVNDPAVGQGSEDEEKYE
ncbi:MAG TPA: hypothetical protein VNF26_06845, partial [Candidatus Baltobacterales bacterium]|nr:hypothetical protein [Candidatus Baltobacterales bacterium]